MRKTPSPAWASAARRVSKGPGLPQHVGVVLSRGLSAGDQPRDERGGGHGPASDGQDYARLAGWDEVGVDQDADVDAVEVAEHGDVQAHVLEDDLLAAGVEDAEPADVLVPVGRLHRQEQGAGPSQAPHGQASGRRPMARR